MFSRQGAITVQCILKLQESEAIVFDNETHFSKFCLPTIS